MIFKDSLGYAHTIAEPFLKAFCPAPAEPPPGEFRRLVDEIVSMRSRRRMAERVKNTPVNTRDPKSEKEAARVSRSDHLPAIRQRPARPASAVQKSFAAMVGELEAMAKTAQATSERIQRDTALALIADLTDRALAGRMGSIEAAKLDALAHLHARVLGMETTGVRS